VCVCVYLRACLTVFVCVCMCMHVRTYIHIIVCVCVSLYRPGSLPPLEVTVEVNGELPTLSIKQSVSNGSIKTYQFPTLSNKVNRQ
jgi:hypothetical protein